ncbi:TPA: DUF4354 family protein [Pseudomonas aeruginosa]|nr:DUF4354 family protein [Pseudomonas aeruginosa]
MREKFRWKPSDLQNTRRPAFLGTALDRGEKTHGKSPGRSVFAKGNQYEERNGPDPGRPAGRSFPRLRRRAGCSDGLRPPGRQGQRIRRRQALPHPGLQGPPGECGEERDQPEEQLPGGAVRRRPVLLDEGLTADTLKPGASVEGDAIFASEDDAVYGASLVRLSDRCK